MARALCTPRIATAQLDVAQKAEDRQAEQARQDINLKYIELFYQDMRSGDPKKQLAALGLCKLMNTDVGTILASWAQEIAPSLQQQARQTQDEIVALQGLKGFKVGIYFPVGQPHLKERAENMRSKLVARGVYNVAAYPKGPQFFVENTAPTEDEIRYDSGEENAASTLQSILEDIYRPGKFPPKQLGKRTPNFISVFLAES